LLTPFGPLQISCAAPLQEAAQILFQSPCWFLGTAPPRERADASRLKPSKAIEDGSGTTPVCVGVQSGQVESGVTAFETRSYQPK